MNERVTGRDTTRMNVNIAYLILAHNNPQHLQRLIRALSTPSSAFFLHIDQKTSMSMFSNLTGADIEVLHERIPVYWGDFSQVEATLRLIRRALQAQRAFDYFVLLSGGDYPIQPASYIERFFGTNRGREFIDIVQMPSQDAGKPLSRLTTYQPTPSPSSLVRVARKLLLTTRIVSPERDYKPYFGDIVPYGGSTWWALTREACQYIQTFVANHAELVQFYRNTGCPDESFFQTILGNSPFKSNIRRSLMYADWRRGGSHPAYITTEHLDLLTHASSVTVNDVFGAGELLFARKFSDESIEVVQRLDQYMSQRNSA